MSGMTQEEKNRMTSFLAVAKAEAKDAARRAIVRLFLSSPSGQVSKEMAERHATEVYEDVIAAYLNSYREEELIRQRLEAGCTVLAWLNQPTVQ